MDDSIRTILLIALGVALLYLGSWIRRRARRTRTPQPGVAATLADRTVTTLQREGILPSE